MGVQGLTGYIRHHGLVPDVTLPSEFDPWPRFVIDGTSLVHRLYYDRFEWALGGTSRRFTCVDGTNINSNYTGQYTDFCVQFEAYLRDILGCGIKIPMIVFDGGRASPSKAAERRDRDTRRTGSIVQVVRSLASKPLVYMIGGKPTLSPAVEGTEATERVFGNYNGHSLPVLVSMHAADIARRVLGAEHVHIAEGEGDALVAHYANIHDAYAIGHDSDYYVFPMRRGYLTLETMSIADVDDDEDGISYKVVRAEYFVRTALAASVVLPDPHFPLLAACLGNDYVGEEVLARPIYKKATGGSSMRNATSALKIATIARQLKVLASNASLLSADCDPLALIPHVLHYVAAPKAVHIPGPAHGQGLSKGAKKRAKLRAAAAVVAAATETAADSGDAPSDADDAAPKVPPEHWMKVDPRDAEKWHSHPMYDTLVQAVKEYSLHFEPPSNLSPEATQLLARHARGEVAPPVADVVLHQTVHCSPMMEDIARTPAWHASAPIRRYAYRVTGVPFVVEHCRSARNAVEIGRTVREGTTTSAPASAPPARRRQTARALLEAMEDSDAPIVIDDSSSDFDSSDDDGDEEHAHGELDQIAAVGALVMPILERGDERPGAALLHAAIAALVTNPPAPDMVITLDLLLATVLAAEHPVSASELDAVRVTMRGQHWISMVDAAVLSLLMTPTIPNTCHASLPKVDSVAAHYYLARVHIVVAAEFARLPPGWTGPARNTLVRRIVAEYVPEVDADGVAARLDEILSLCGTELPVREVGEREADESKQPEDWRREGARRKALRKQEQRVAAAATTGDTLASLGLSHLF
ncbi:hypothetical protein BC828DRAFT_379611 [Blastocladiella britannica]|nr:hypothetical protein BC828DRAFT_379611 [Blastocladiella britannica]